MYGHTKTWFRGLGPWAARRRRGLLGACRPRSVPVHLSEAQQERFCHCARMVANAGMDRDVESHAAFPRRVFPVMGQARLFN